MAESVHAAVLRERGFGQIPRALQYHSVTQKFIADNPTAGPFFYKATVEESSATIAIDELERPWFVWGTVNLTDLGFTECPVPY